MDSDLEQRRTAEQEAIDRCSSEEIHLLGTVQPFGWLIGVERTPDMVITHVSENVADLAGLDPQSLLGTDLGSQLSSEITHALRNAAGHSTITTQREFVGTESFDGGAAFDVSAYASNERLIVEFQQVQEAGPSAGSVLGEAQRAIVAGSEADDLSTLLDVLVEQLRSITGYDRVMAYKFMADGAGEIVAESLAPTVSSFLGLRFPAFDIPPVARALYATTPIRVIGDVEAAQPAILGLGPDPLDLSLALLRGTVVGHMTYLSNMGLRSTMSLPIVVDGEMWGLFSFHHREATVPSAIVAAACELLGRSASSMIQGLLDKEHAARVELCSALAADLFVIDDGPLGFTASWHNAHADLIRLLPFDGVALIGTDRVESHGDCPQPAAVIGTVNELSRDIGEPADDSGGPAGNSTIRVIAEDRLRDRLPDLDLGPSAGALLLQSPVPRVEAIVFFRNEVATSIKWAGQPAAGFRDDDEGLRLTPRGSFEAYMETVDGRSTPWSDEDRHVADALLTAFERLRLHWAGESQRLQRERLELMVRELNHRVRNILALVRSLISQTAHQSNSLDEYVGALEHRVAALAGAHNLLTESGWESVELADLVDQTVGAYKDSFSVDGPSLKIRPNLASLLSLVLHELSSNAAKYGALSVPSGRVQVGWAVRNNEFRLTWVERGGPTVVANPRVGFGSSIIKNALPFEFGGEAELIFEPTGVRAEFALAADIAQIDAQVADVRQTSQTFDTRGLRVLIVEDDFIIGTATSSIAHRLGATEVRLEPTVAGAIQLITTESFDLAILDANLRGEFSAPIAEALTEHGVPFLFLTGYGSKDRELQALGAMAVITKPASEEQLRPYFEGAIQSVLDLRGAPDKDQRS